MPVGYQTRNFNAMSLVNFRVISQTADGSEGVFFMNYENAPAGSDYDNDMKGYLRYIVSGNTIKIIMHESGSSAGANQKMGYIIDGVADAGTHYLVANNHINATDNTGGGGTFTTQPIAVIDALCADCRVRCGPDHGCQRAVPLQQCDHRQRRPLHARREDAHGRHARYRLAEEPAVVCRQVGRLPRSQ